MKKEWTEQDEKKFRIWYAYWVNFLKSKGQMLDPDPDNPLHQYDYRKAYINEVEPQLTEHGDYRWSDIGKSPNYKER